MLVHDPKRGIMISYLPCVLIEKLDFFNFLEFHDYTDLMVVISFKRIHRINGDYTTCTPSQS